MALTLTVTTPHGFCADDAYHRVEGLEITNEKQLVFHLRSYKAPEGFPQFDSRLVRGDYNLAGPNPFEQAYSQVKKLPGFEFAKDC